MFILFQTLLEIFQHIQFEAAEARFFPRFDVHIAAEDKHIVTGNQTAEQGDRFQTAFAAEVLIPPVADGDVSTSSR